MKLLPNNQLALRVREPARILAVIPHAVQHPNNVVVLHHGLEEAKILRNLGYKAPSPIVADYDWPGGFSPFAHQLETASFMTLHNRCFVLLEMGLGKTISSLWASDYLMREKQVGKVLIMSTLSCLDSTWQREIFRNLMHRTSMVVHGTKAQRMAALAQDVDYYILNHHGLLVPGLAEELRKREDIDLIILDEASMLRNSTTRIYKTFTKMLRPDQRLWLLSARPCPNGPTDAWGLAKLVSPSRVPQFFTRWKDETMRKVSMWKWEPREDAKEKMHNAMQPAIIFKKEDCLDLPPTTYLDRNVPMSDIQHRYYQMMKTQLAVYAQEHEITAVNAAVLLSKLLQICAGAVRTNGQEYLGLDVKGRLSVLDELIEEANAKTIVFVPYTGALRQVAVHLEQKYGRIGMIDGSVGRNKRSAILAEFNDSKSMPILLAHPKTASHGLNLTVADTMVWFSPIHSLDVYEQANERMARPGQKLTTRIGHLGSCALEWNAYKVLRTKGAQQAEFLELFKQELQS